MVRQLDKMESCAKLTRIRFHFSLSLSLSLSLCLRESWKQVWKEEMKEYADASETLLIFTKEYPRDLQPVVIVTERQRDKEEK